MWFIVPFYGRSSVWDDLAFWSEYEQRGGDIYVDYAYQRVHFHLDPLALSSKDEPPTGLV